VRKYDFNSIVLCIHKSSELIINLVFDLEPIEHDDNVFTKGIILNRPSNLVLSDEDFVNSDGSPLDGSSEDNQWKTWFGGEVSGILSDEPEIICIHFLDNEEADKESEIIMKGIKVRDWTKYCYNYALCYLKYRFALMPAFFGSGQHLKVRDYWYRKDTPRRLTF